MLTAAGAVGLCLFAVAQGWAVVAVATAREHGGTSDAPVPSWLGSPVAAVTLDRQLDNIGRDGEEAPGRRVELLSRLLALRPLSSVAWLSLAGMRAATGAPFGEVLAALRMSAVTGPNEARVMWQRGLFCLLQWEILPAEFQSQAARDLAAPLAAGLADDGDAGLASRLLAARSAEARSQIAAMLKGQGVDAAALRQLGLDVAP